MKNSFPTLQKLTLCTLLSAIFACSNTDNSASVNTSKNQAEKPEVAFLSSQSGNLEVYIKDLNTEQLKQITDNTLDDLNPVWSPSGEQLAFIGRTLTSTYLNVYDTASQKTTILVDDSYMPAWINWSPNKNEIAFVSNKTEENSLYTTDLNGNIHLLFESPQGVLISPKYSRDGSILAVIENDSLSLVQNGQVKNTLFPKKFRILDFDWGKDNKTVYVTARVNREINIHEVDLDTLETKLLIEGPYLDVEARFSPPNKLVFLSSRIDGGTRQLYLYNLDTQNTQQMTPTNLEVMHPAWSSSGKHISYTTNLGKQFTSMILDLESGEISPISEEKSGFHLLPTIRP